MNLKNNEWLIEEGELKAYFGSASEIVIPNGITAINGDALKDLTITKLVIPGTCKNIPALSLTFKPITNLILEEGITTIAKNACLGCNITSLTLPKTLKVIENSAFYSNNISTLELYDTIEVIAPLSFESNPITKIIIHNSGHVTHILRQLKNMPNTLSWFDNLTSITILDNKLTLIEQRCIAKIFANTNVPDIIKVEAPNPTPVKQNLSLPSQTKTPEKSTSLDKTIPDHLTEILNNTYLDIELKQIITIIFDTAQKYDYPKIPSLIAEIEHSIATYQSAITSITPRLSFNESISLTLSEEDPRIIRNRFLSYLKNMVIRLKTWHTYTSLINAITNYEFIITHETTPKIEYSALVNTIITICNIAQDYSNNTILTKLQNILSDTKKELTLSIAKLEKYPAELNYQTRLEAAISNLYQETKRYELIESTFRGEKDSELSCDIKAIYEAISYFTKNAQEPYKKKIDHEINYYKEILLNNPESNLATVELNLRANWHTTLIDINKNLPEAVDIRHVLEDIDEALSLLEPDSKITPLSLIGTTTRELIDHLNNPLLKPEEYNLGLEEIKNLLTNLKNTITNSGLTILENEETLLLPDTKPRPQVKPLTIELVIQIISKLYAIKYRIIEDIKQAAIYADFKNTFKR